MDIALFFDTLQQSDTKNKVEKRSGIAIKLLQEIEKKLDIQLPDDLVNFYTFSNGLDGDESIFNIIPLTEISKLKDNVGHYLEFAEYLIYSETCFLEIDPLDKNKYRIFTQPVSGDSAQIQRHYKSDSITDFIQLYCDKGTFGIFGDE